MKFKVIESNDYDYDAKDKNFYYSWDFYNLMRKVGEDPKRITFNPLQAKMQYWYLRWQQDRRDRIIQKVLSIIIFTLVLIAIAILILEVMGVQV